MTIQPPKKDSEYYTVIEVSMWDWIKKTFNVTEQGMVDKYFIKNSPL